MLQLKKGKYAQELQMENTLTAPKTRILGVKMKFLVKFLKQLVDSSG